MSTESRQVRRWRQRQKVRWWPTTCFVLLCRIVDPGGAAWAITGVETPDEGDAFARAIQSQVAEIPEVVPARCELVENSDQALQR